MPPENGQGAADNPALKGWSKGLPEIRGQDPEIRLNLSGSGISMDPSYSIDGGGWNHTLSEVKAMNPKPSLIVTVSAGISINMRDKMLKQIGAEYECVEYKCFFQ